MADDFPEGGLGCMAVALPAVAVIHWLMSFSPHGRDRLMYYDREGRPLSYEEYIRYLTAYGDSPEAVMKRKRVAESTVGEYWVSTVWLGLDHGIGRRLEIFETMIWRGEEGDLYMERWSTEAEAVAGHDQIAAAVREGTLPPPSEEPEPKKGTRRWIWDALMGDE